MTSHVISDMIQIWHHSWHKLPSQVTSHNLCYYYMWQLWHFLNILLTSQLTLITITSDITTDITHDITQYDWSQEKTISLPSCYWLDPPTSSQYWPIHDSCSIQAQTPNQDWSTAKVARSFSERLTFPRQGFEGLPGTQLKNPSNTQFGSRIK